MLWTGLFGEISDYFLFLSLDCAKWNNLRLPIIRHLTQLVIFMAFVTGLLLNLSPLVTSSVTTL